MQLTEIKTLCERVRENINRVIVGKEEVITHLLIAMVAGGHVLLEDVPGTGKTLLAKSAAKSIDCAFGRIQFTPDLLPSDLTGINFYDQKSGEFRFRPGAVFTNILLGDEINRATPRTQSALLECMEERQVTIDGVTTPLSAPFMVIATQNPVETAGTFPLPEAQLDRFLIKTDMGYPTPDEGAAILARFKTENPLDSIAPVASAAEIIDASRSFSAVYAAPAMLDYIIRIAEETRRHNDIVLGVSPRGTQALLRTVQVHAILAGRDFITPDDVKAMAYPVFGHRIILKNTARVKKGMTGEIIAEILNKVAVPTETLAE
jgi:MoxR-like ATPase